MSNWQERITNQRYFYHYLFWGIVLLSYVVDAAELRHFNPQLFLYTLFLKNGLLIGIVYLHLRVLIPAFLKSRRHGLYVVSLVLTIACGAWLTNRVEAASWRHVHHERHEKPAQQSEPAEKNLQVEIEEEVVVHQSAPDRLLLDVLTVCRYLVISILLKFIDDFFQQREQLQQMRHEKTMAELGALKAQINPHFLFNTLNNLYGLALERNPLTADALLKLADIMKYTLAEGEGESVPLQRDLENLQNYFDLERLRLAEGADVSMDIAGTVENQRIAPLLLLPLLENAFKHGVHCFRENQFLKVSIEVDGARILFKTRNRKSPESRAAESLGMGLDNVRKRLALLYEGRHRLDIDANGAFFQVTLELRLK